MRRRLLLAAAVLLPLLGLATGWSLARPWRRPLAVSPAALVPTAEPRRADLLPATDSSAPQPASLVAPTPLSLPTARTLVVAGLDRGPGKVGAGLADSIVVLLLHKSGAKAALISIPRDTMVKLGDFGEGRINTVINVAHREKVDAHELLQRVVSELLGVKVSHSLVVDLGVLERGVDALGGVPVVVPCPIIDDFVDPRTESGRRVLDVPAGEVAMDGPTAAMYARSRHGRSDWSRARRQQAILLGLRRKLESVDGLSRLPALLEEMRSSISTDLRRYELLDLARQVASLPPGALHGVVLSERETLPYVTPEGQAVLVPQPDLIHEVMAKAFEAGTPGKTPEAAQCPAAEAALSHRRRGAPPSGAEPIPAEEPHPAAVAPAALTAEPTQRPAAASHPAVVVKQ